MGVATFLEWYKESGMVAVLAQGAQGGCRANALEQRLDHGNAEVPD